MRFTHTKTMSVVRRGQVLKKEVSSLYKASRCNESRCVPSYISKGKSSSDDASLDCPEWERDKTLLTKTASISSADKEQLLSAVMHFS